MSTEITRLFVLQQPANIIHDATVNVVTGTDGRRLHVAFTSCGKLLQNFIGAHSKTKDWYAHVRTCTKCFPDGYPL